MDMEGGVLIESDWNLKYVWTTVLYCKMSRINRIRLEFKAEGQTAGLLGI